MYNSGSPIRPCAYNTCTLFGWRYLFSSDAMIERFISNYILQWYIIHVLPTPVSMARVIPMVTISNAAVIMVILETPVTNIKV